MKWKEIAIHLYMKLHGRRCVLCSSVVEVKDAHVEVRNQEYFLMHKVCYKEEQK